MEHYRKKFEDDLQSGRTYLDSKRSAELLSSIHNRIRNGSTGDPVSRMQARLATILSIAAMALLCVMAGWLVREHHATGKTSETERIATSIKGMSWYTNGNTIDSVFTLSDGSEVTLYPGSSIRLIESFTASARKVQLSGKACFHVAKDVRRPFTVYANDIATTAIGTRFEVDTRENNTVSVHLIEGKVVVQSTNSLYFDKDIYLVAGENFSYNRYSGQLAVTRGKQLPGRPKPGYGVQPAMLKTTPKNDLIEFVQEPLVSVLKKLGAHYQTSFRYDSNAVRHIQVTGSIRLSDPLEQVMMILEAVNNIKFRRTGNTIYVESLQ